MERVALKPARGDALGSLLARYQETGEDPAIDELVARTRPRLLAIARRIAGATGAEDAVQAAYLALVSQKRPAAEVRVEAWLTAATIRRAYRQRALDRRHVQLAEKLGTPAPDGDPALVASRREEGASVLGEVERLPARYRDPIVLHHLQGLAAAEVAMLLDLPRGTVLSRLRRGRALLEPRLASRGAYAVTVLPLVFFELVRSVLPIGGGVVKTKMTIAAVLIGLCLGGGVWIASQGDPVPAENGALAAGGDAAGAGDGGATGTSDGGADAGGTDELQAASGRDPDAPEAPATAATGAAPETVEAPEAEDAEAGGLRGRVVDEAGNPVSGATVHAFAMPGGDYDHRLRKQGTQTHSGADGAFVFAPREEDTCGVYAEAPGFATRGKSWMPVPASSQAVEIVLTPVAQASGKVLDAEGTPLVGAVVSLRRPEGQSPSMREWRRLQTKAESAADGSYALERLPPGEVELAAWHRNAAEESIVIDLAVGEHVRNLDFQLSPGFSVAGVVVDERGTPIADAVVLDGDSRANPRIATTDASGQFRMGGLAAGEVRLTASHDGYGLRAGGYPRGVAAQPGDDDVRIVLFRAVTVTGVVRDAFGNPVEGAVVKGGPGLRGSPQALSTSWMGNEEIYWTRSVAEGAFALEGLPPGKLDFLALHDDHEPSKLATLTLALGEDASRIELVLAAGLQIAGRVVDEAGQPVAGARVWMASTETSPLNRRSSGFGPKSVSGDDGRFTVGGLSPTGVYRFEVRGDGWMSPGSRDHQVAPGAEDVLLTVKMGGVISGHLVGPDGSRRAGQLRLDELTTGQDFPGTRTLHLRERATADEGFTFTGVPAGTYTLGGDGDGDLLLLEQTIELADGEQREGVELAYAAGSSVQGRVVNEDGDPVAGVGIYVHRPKLRGQPLQGTTADDGAFDIGPFPEGEYSLSLGSVPGGYLPAHGHRVTTGELVEIVLSRGLTLTGRILLPNGQPATSLHLQTSTSEERDWGRRPPRSISCSEGQFELDGVALDSTALSIRVPGCATLEVALAGLPSAGRHDLGDIQLLAGAGFSAKVVDAAGQPVEGASVMLLEADVGLSASPRAVGETEAAGTCTFEHVEAGAVLLLVEAGEAGRTTRELTLEDGVTTPELLVEMPPTAILTGRVVEADGSPRAGIHVQTQQQPLAGENVTLLQSRETVTDPDGNYRIAGIVAGTHNVSVHPEGRYTRSVARQRIVIEAGVDATCDLSLTE